MGSLTLLQTVLMAMPFFLSLTFNSLPLNCNNNYKKTEPDILKRKEMRRGTDKSIMLCSMLS